MKKKDFFIALLVVIVWGANFTAIRLGLDGVPSMLLVAIRYTLVVFPAIFFVKKPDVSWKYIFFYGLTVGAGQFGALFLAMEIGMPAGLASIVVQLQAFISPLLATIFLSEKISPKQLIGFLIGGVGLFIIGLASTTSSLASIPLGAILLTILAPLFWSISNIIAKFAAKKAEEEGKKLDMFRMVIWSALVPPIPMLILSIIIDSPSVIISSLLNLSPIAGFSAAYVAYLSTIFGYGTWGVLLTKYSLSKISPLSLLVPITGLLTAMIVLNERLTSMQWIGALVILFGLLVANLDIKGILKTNTSRGS